MNPSGLFNERISRRTVLKTAAGAATAMTGTKNPVTVLAAFLDGKAPLASTAIRNAPPLQLIQNCIILHRQETDISSAIKAYISGAGLHITSGLRDRLTMGVWEERVDPTVEPLYEEYIRQLLEEVKTTYARMVAESALFADPEKLELLYRQGQHDGNEGESYLEFDKDTHAVLNGDGTTADKKHPGTCGGLTISKKMHPASGESIFTLHSDYFTGSPCGTEQSMSKNFTVSFQKDGAMNDFAEVVGKLLSHPLGRKGLYDALSFMPDVKAPIEELLTASEYAEVSNGLRKIFPIKGNMGQLRQRLQAQDDIGTSYRKMVEKFGHEFEITTEQYSPEAQNAWNMATSLDWRFIGGKPAYYEAEAPLSTMRRTTGGEYPVYDRAQGIIASVNLQAARAGEAFELRAKSVHAPEGQRLRIPAKLFQDREYLAQLGADLHNPAFAEGCRERLYWKQVEEDANARVKKADLSARDHKYYESRADYIASGRPAAPSR